MRKKILLMLMSVCCAVFVAHADVDVWVNTGEALITQGSQLSDNCAWNENYQISCLISGDSTNHFHSNPSNNIADGGSYFQVALDEAQNAFAFYLRGRGDGMKSGSAWYDTPDLMEIQASNTPDDADSWKTVYTWDEQGNIEKDHYVEYTSKVITMDEAYSNIRFIVKHTATGNPYFNLNAFQMYKAVHLTTYKAALEHLVDSVQGLNREYAVGTAAGYYDAAKVAGFNDAVEEADKKLSDASLADADYEEPYTSLLEAFEAVQAAWTAPSVGYYFLVSTDSLYDDGDARAMYINSLGELSWGKLNTSAPEYLFQLTEDSTGWKLYNPAQRRYVGAPSGSYVATSASSGAALALTHYLVGTPAFKITTATGKVGYAITGEGDGTVAEGRIGTIKSATATSAAGWKLQVVDEEAANALIAQANSAYYGNLLQNTVDDALRLRTKVVELTPLITDASQIEANDAANLIDGDRSTYSESADGIDFDNDEEYIEISLNEAVKEFTLEYVGRKNATSYDTPNKFVLSVSKDGKTYNEVGTYDIKSLSNASEAQYVSPVISLDDEYSYVKLDIKGVTSKADKWNLSELQLYSSEKKASSEYLLVDGMSAAVDALDAAVADALAKIAAGTVAESDTATLNAAVAAVEALYVDKDAVAAKLETEIEAARTVYEKAFRYDDLLVEAYNDSETSGLGQITGNGTWFQAALAYATLIDGKEDMTSFFHSSLDAITANRYLQFDLRRNVSKFTFWMDGAPFYNPAFPSKIDVYAANSTDGEWTYITQVTNPNSPATADNYHFQSDIVNLGADYRYIRFYVKDGGYGSAAPYFMISEMQITDASPNEETSQYYYMDGVKEPADALDNLMKELEQKIADGMIVNLADTAQLNEAVRNLQDAFYDTDEVESLIDELHDLLDNTPKGDEMGQVDSEVYADTQVSLLETEAELDFDNVDPSAMDEAKENLENLLVNFYANIHTVDSAKWYYILSQANDGVEGGMDMSSEFAEKSVIRNTAMFIRSNAATIQLRWGLKDKYEGDGRAMWHFVPVEGKKYKGYFYIQNLRSGMYIGQSNTGSDCYVSTTRNAMVMRLVPGGNGTFNIVPADTASNSTTALGAGDNANQIRVDVSADGRARWTFVEATSQTAKLRFANNNMSIVTLPFAASGLEENNSDVHTYALKSVTEDGTALNFVSKTSFEAGEPFLLVVGDTVKYTEDHSDIELLVNTPTTDYTLTAGSQDAMHGVMFSATLRSAGYGYFSRAGLKVTNGETAVGIGFQSGYINRSELTVASESETYDLQIKLTNDGTLNGITNAAADVNAAAVNVYTIDGVLLKKNVKAAGATEGLAKGVYIVGKDKVLVK